MFKLKKCIYIFVSQIVFNHNIRRCSTMFGTISWIVQFSLNIFFTFQSVQDTYVNAVSNLKFGGPTCLAHVIEKAANLSERENMSQNKQAYTVLLVITVCKCTLRFISSID
jgi:hypothetical protein